MAQRQPEAWQSTNIRQPPKQPAADLRKQLVDQEAGHADHDHAEHDQLIVEQVAAHHDDCPEPVAQPHHLRHQDRHPGRDEVGAQQHEDAGAGRQSHRGWR